MDRVDEKSIVTYKWHFDLCCQSIVCPDPNVASVASLRKSLVDWIFHSLQSDGVIDIRVHDEGILNEDNDKRKVRRLKYYE